MKKIIQKKLAISFPRPIPIVADKSMIKIDKKIPIINFAWHINKEIKKYLKKLKYKNRVIPILENKDFR